MKHYLSKTQYFVLAFFLLTFASVKAQTIIKTAGTTQGFSGDGAAATNAQLNNPYDVALDASGNIYIADLTNHRIRKITVATGVISTVAGNGVAGFSGDGAAATSAQLNAPFGVAVDAAGNIYIADASNRRIRKVTIASGVISTIAGTGVSGTTGDGAVATSATLISPYGVEVDAANNVYIADPFSYKIRKISASTGFISTVAGTGVAGLSGDGGAATSAQLNLSYRTVVGSNGDIYIADTQNHRIRKVDAISGVITTVAGSTQGFGGDGAVATSALLNLPNDIAVTFAGDLYIADTSNNRVRKVTSGIISTIVGTGVAGNTGDCGLATGSQLNTLAGITIDGVGNIHIADRNNHRTRKIINSAPITSSVASQNNVGCNGGSNGSATVSATGGVGTYTYSWSPSGGTSATATGLSAGTYVCTITDGLLCSQTQSVTIVGPLPTVFSPIAGTLPSAVVGTTYTQNIAVTAGLSGPITFSISPTLPAGLSLTTINSTTCRISGISTGVVAATNYTITATSGSCSSQVIYSLATISCPTFTPSGTVPTNGTVNVPYSLNAGVTVSPTSTITYSVTSLPAGLVLNTATGLISGTPTAVTTIANYIVTASTGGGCSLSTGYTFAINVACPSVSLSPLAGTLTSATVGISYSQAVTQTGLTGTVTFSVSPTLPAGLSINSSNGTISGTPTASLASANYTVTATNGTCSGTVVYSLAVAACPTITFGSATATNGAVGTVYSLNAGATASPTATITYSVLPALPAGLSLNTATGLISGTPTAVTASATYTVKASTSASCNNTKTYTFEVTQNPTTAIDNSLSSLVKVSPNPSNGVFNIDFGGINVAKSFVRVYDAQGKAVFVAENNSNLMSISLDKFANGIYLLEVETSKGRILKRLAKQ